MKPENSKPKTSTPPDIASKHWKHNVHFAEYMFKFLLVFLFSCLILNSFFNYLRSHLFITTGVSKEVENYNAKNDYLWKPIHHHSDIKIYATYERKNGTHVHPIYHYDYKTDIPLEAFLDVLDHPNQSMEWFAWLRDHKYMGVRKNDLDSLDILSNTVHSQMIIHPMIHLQDREFLTEVTSNVKTQKIVGRIGREKTIATFVYRNLGGDEVENKFSKHDHKNCIRGALDMYLQLTTMDDGNTTHISMEVDMDMYPSSSRSKESLTTPWMLMDKTVMRWGELSLHKLVKRCRENLGLDQANLKTSFWNLVPIKR